MPGKYRIVTLCVVCDMNCATARLSFVVTASIDAHTLAYTTLFATEVPPVESCAFVGFTMSMRVPQSARG